MPNGKPIQQLSYTYDNKLNLRTRRDNAAGIVEGFEYDELNRIQRWTILASR
jgi:YD repeat-containing protein